MHEHTSRRTDARTNQKPIYQHRIRIARCSDMAVKMKEVLLDDFIPTLLRSNTFNFNDYHLMPMTLRGVRQLMEPVG